MLMNMDAFISSVSAPFGSADFFRNMDQDANRTLNGRRLVIADRALEDVTVLLDNLEPGTALWYVDSPSDVAATLHAAFLGGYGALHFLGHGREGAIILGGRLLEVDDFTALSCREDGHALSLHFWSCMTGAGAKGRAFVDGIAQAFGAAVTAFSGLVGAGLKGGSWSPDVFSRQSGFVDLPFRNMLDYPHTLQASALQLHSVATATGVYVQVWLAAGVVIDAADLVLSYNTTKVSYTGAVANSDLTGWSWQSNEDFPGQLLVSGMSLTQLNSGSDLLLETISFTSVSGSDGLNITLAGGENGTTLTNSGGSEPVLGTLPAINYQISVDNVSVDIAENHVASEITGADADAVDLYGHTVPFSLLNVPTNGSGASLFSIDSSTGQVSLTTVGVSALDYESVFKSYSLTVKASDGVTWEDHRSITVNLTNIDESAPTITSGATATAINENSGAGQLIYTATSTDSGDITTGTISYSLKTGCDAGLTINSSSGAVTLTANPDYETKNSYSFTVVATDAASNSSEKAVMLQINNLNDNAPVFTSGGTGSVDENASTNTVIYTAATTDADNLAARTYTLSGTDAGLLDITSGGVVTLKASANFEIKSSYSFDVIAYDGLNDTTQPVVVSVHNVNDAPKGSVAITGMAIQGQTLTASNTLSDEDGLGTIVYQWKAGSENIIGAASDSYILTASEVGKTISVKASYIDGRATTEHVDSSATAAVVGLQSGIVQDGYLSKALVWVDTNNDGQLNWNDTDSDTVWDAGESATESWTLTDSTGQFSGLVGVGTIHITANLSNVVTNPDSLPTIDISTGKSFTGNYSAPSGSTVVNPLTTLVVAAGGNEDAVKTALGLDAHLDLSTYDPLAEAAKTGSSDAAKAIAIAVQSAATQVANIMDIAASVATGAGAGSTTGVSASVASALMTAAAGGTVNLANTTVIAGAITSAAEDAGGTTTGLTTVINAVADSSAAVNNNIKELSDSVKNTANSGGTVNVDDTLKQVVAAQIVAQETVAGQAETAAKSNSTASLTVTSSTVDTDITTASSDVQTIFINHAPTGDVTMTGIATQGHTLTAHNTLADIDGLSGTIRYQWQVDEVDISGATGATLLLAEAQADHQVRVVASYTDDAGHATSVNSNATSVASQHSPTGSVMITGTAISGQTLTASNTLADADALGAITYQWYSGNMLIGTGNTFLVSNAQEGLSIKVTATYTDGHGTAESVSSHEIPYGVTLGDIAHVTTVADLRNELAALLPLSGFTNGTDVQEGIAAYYNAFTTGGTEVAVRSVSFSSGVTGLTFSVNSVTHEALVIDTTNLPLGSELDLNNVDFAIIIGGENITIRGGAGNNIVFAGSGSQDIFLGPGTDILHGGDGSDRIASNGGDDQLYGDGGNDTLSGGPDNDLLDGGSGDDTALFSGKFADYSISYNAATDQYTVADKVVGRDGTDTVINVEYFQFADVTKDAALSLTNVESSQTAVADPFAPIDHDDGVGTVGVLAGLGALGILAWVIF